ncbi:MAG TPA: DNA-binding transcriptional regulator [Tepidisphaeraceae bacterium]|nr:DNA-binding transcriptional regulator [Tepidisphaeraceae bacterium]
MRGIAKYNRTIGNWSTWVRPHGENDPPPNWLKNWHGDGILVRIDSKETADLVRKTKVPAVNLRVTKAEYPFPFVSVDNAEIGEMAAKHLLERGLRHFAIYSRPRGVNPTLDERCDAFKSSVIKAGFSCDVFSNPKSSKPLGWEEQQDALTDWVQLLPRPLGIMAGNDEFGLQVLDACRRCSLAVPDEVAVVGVDNDEPLCELAIPPLSSIDPNTESIGYEAAQLLDRMMAGGKSPKDVKPIKVKPRGVVTRRSSDVVASEDEEVARAARFIRDNACQGLQVIDVLAHVGMSRASLQQRMKQILGRTIHQEIQRVRLHKVKDRLLAPGLTIKQVARESGFASVQYMTRVFHAITGETPAQYRNRRLK